LWLDPLTEDTANLKPLLIPASEEFLTSHPVSNTVNAVKNQGPELILPLTLGDQYPCLNDRLFP